MIHNNNLLPLISNKNPGVESGGNEITTNLRIVLFTQNCSNLCFSMLIMH